MRDRRWREQQGARSIQGIRHEAGAGGESTASADTAPARTSQCKPIECAMTNSWQYDLKPDDKGWTVYSTKTGEPVRLNGAPQVGLTRAVAEEVVQTLGIFQPGPNKSEPE